MTDTKTETAREIYDREMQDYWAERAAAYRRAVLASMDAMAQEARLRLFNSITEQLGAWDPDKEKAPCQSGASDEGAEKV